jgi:hypothetical protein
MVLIQAKVMMEGKAVDCKRREEPPYLYSREKE